MEPLVIKHLEKTYALPNGKMLRAVDDVSLRIAPGTIHGLLGPNGAGKSTIIGMIAGMTLPTSGTISVFDVDVIANPNQAKALIGIVPQEVTVEMAFTVEEVLYYFSGMYGVPAAERSARIDAVLEDLQLTDKKHEKARLLSGGMKRRLMIAKAILHKPKLLILDEPTAGVDVALRQKIWDLVRRMNAEGTTIIFTTHYLEEAEELCERITLINHGKIVAEGSLKDLQQSFALNTIQFSLTKPPANHLPNVTVTGTTCSMPLKELSADLAALTAHYGTNLKDVKSEAASLEQIFLTLTK
jgi:ABC-2 type transport system ATP-binding protein